jgi:dTMP kinase
VFDIDPEVGMLRKGKPTDRIEAAGQDFHWRVKRGFLELALFHSQRIKVIDASKPLVEVVGNVVELIKKQLGWEKTKEI